MDEVLRPEEQAGRVTGIRMEARLWILQRE